MTIERAAAAMAESTNGGKWHLDYTEEQKQLWMTRARAAIEALRDPTVGMLEAARDWSVKKNGRGVGNDQATGCWQSMIDAALGT